MKDCTARTIVALCAGEDCQLYWCSPVAPALASVRQLQNPDGTWVPLPGSIRMRPASRTGQIPSATVFSRSAGGTFTEAAAETTQELAVESAGKRDVIPRLLILRKPGDVAQWWLSGPRGEPEQWTHPLSEWERRYIEKLSAPTVPAPVRMRPPVAPERLTSQELEEAKRLFGSGTAAAHSFSNWENRRRIVSHYVWTHPATLRLTLAWYGLARDTNPLFFSLERGWQVASGKELFTEQDVSRLGAAAEFFTALAVGVAANKLLGAVRPAPPAGVRPPSQPDPGLRNEALPPADATGKVVPLDGARAARSTRPETRPTPAMEEPPVASTGTDGPPPGPKKGSGRG
ncbi:MAG TPA: hypothetical protein VK447_02835, partial [Myxococcaceae bacterium]|nr:hypothetical protein [Myxococcaceae bacterium]